MKRFILLIFFSGIVLADSLDVITIAGVKGGGGLGFFSSNISKAYKEEKARPVYDGGIFISREYYQQLALSLELLVRSRGGIHRSVYPVVDGREEFTETGLELLYVELPIIVKLRMGESPVYSPSLYAGISPAFNISATQTYSDEASSGENNLDHLDSNDTGVIFGFEIWKRLGKNNILLDLRLNSSLNLHTVDYLDASGNRRGEYQFTTYGFNIHIGYAFTL